MSDLFPYANFVAGVLVLLVGFGTHFVGQLISVLNWSFAKRIGLQDRNLPAEYFPYEHGTAMADVLIAWLYGVAAIGLIMNAEWGYKLAWVPGSILLYHGLCAWFWEADRRAAGRRLWSERYRMAWCGANAATGALTLAVAWAGMAPAPGV